MASASDEIGTISTARGDSSRALPIFLTIAAALLGLALVGRIMGYPIQHDEQFYLPPGILFGTGHLYADIGFSHMPNLPILVSALIGITGTDHFLLVGRLLVIAAWSGAAWFLVRIGRERGAATLAIAGALSLLLFDPNFLGEAGMAATNNFLPVPLALAGMALFLTAARGGEPRPLAAAASGLCLALAAGFKANYAPLIAPFALAAFLVPPAWPLRQRLIGLVLPMAAGGLVGAAPALSYLLSDPAGFVAHVIETHRGPQIAYWLANPDPADPKVMGLGAKLILARKLWFSGTVLLLLSLIAVHLLLLGESIARGRRLRDTISWPTCLFGAATLVAALVAFLPDPAFPQYYTLPVPYGLALLLSLHGDLDRERRQFVRYPFGAAIGLAALIGAPLVVSGLASAARPWSWTAFKVHADSVRLAGTVRAAGAGTRVATLIPLQTLEGGLTVDPHLALGPFIYRAGDYFPPEQRRHYRRLASPTTIGEILAADPPAAVLVGEEGKLDAPLAAFALANGYRPTPFIPKARGSAKSWTLYLRPSARPTSAAE